MKFSISNIGWSIENDVEMYTFLKEKKFDGIEIAPTRIIQENPYYNIEKAIEWKKALQSEFGFEISSMQSIWYGRQENIFESKEERESLLEYTKRAIDFAKAIECQNLVFGCPRNRNIPDNMTKVGVENIVIEFFKELGEYAYKSNTVLALEANPTIYNTNFINDTQSALEMVKIVDSKGFLLNLDIGTMIQNNENIDELIGNVKYINHVHISEPRLATIVNRQMHKDILNILKNENYQRYISIEVGNQGNIECIHDAVEYVGGLVKK